MPGQYSSGGKAQLERITKAGDAYLSLKVRKSHTKATVAAAHKMLRLIFLILDRRQPYIDRHIKRQLCLC